MTNLYRLYVDESGSPDYSTTDTLKHRYLGLLGVCVSEEVYKGVLEPGIMAMRLLVADDSSNPPVLHREEIVNKVGVFAKLADPKIEKAFNNQFIALVNDMDYCLCSVVIDKMSHFERYGASALHPYHYCMNVLLERYVRHLSEVGGRGDVLAEARGKTEDRALAAEYSRFHDDGTYYCRPPLIQTYLTTKELKLKKKNDMIAGLEFTDLLSIASRLDVLHDKGVLPSLTENFTKVIIDAIQSKYRCSSAGVIDGVGRKFLE